MKQKLFARGRIPTKSGCSPLFLTFVLLLFLAGQNFSNAQTTQLIFGATPTYMNISNGTAGTPIYLVIGNPANTAIARTAGWIISEGEYNYVQWSGTTSLPTTYVIPFGYSNTFYLPFTFTKTVGAASDLRVSTWASGTDNKVAGAWASGVTNMYDQNIGADGSVQAVIDRWWSINVPVASTANLTFSYRGLAENTTDASFGGPGGNFGAQRWNGAYWQAPVGSNPGVVAGVGAVTANAINTFTSLPWVLSKTLAPLPVEWLSLSAECNRGDVTISWSTASEQNSDYFTVERSLDGNNFSAIATKPAGGNTSTIQNYSAVDADAYSGISFYRVKETDFNGAYIYSGTITVSGCAGDDIIIYGEEGGAAININALEDGQYNIEMFDVLGQKITGQIANVTAGNNHIKLSPNNIASAIYVVKVFNNNNAIAKKVFIRSDY
ncbi:MAG: T9SS type A sorting domain-containing protein [Bacteroidetes bacterium]|nr:T9SS type A sorting domain-containing protein [Bacteroidota bacterium]